MSIRKVSFTMCVIFILLNLMISCATKIKNQDEINKNVFEALLYLPMTEGQGLHYSVSDSQENYNSEIIVVTQNGGKIDNLFTLDFINSEFKLRGSRFYLFETDYWTSNNHKLYRYGGYINYPTHFYSGFSIPIKFKNGDQWERGWFGDSLADFNLQYIGSYNLDGILYEDCFKINIDATHTQNEHIRCSGYYIITPNIGIIEINLTRKNETGIVFKYLKSEIYTKQIISGTIANYGATDPDIYVGLSEFFITPVDMRTGDFTCEVYGPIATLIIGHDKNNDNKMDTEDNSMLHSYFIDDVDNSKNITIDLKSF